MALVLSRVGSTPRVHADRWELVWKAQLDNSYQSGGYACPPSALGCFLSTDADPSKGGEMTVECDSANGWSCVYNYSTQKLQLFSSTATTSTEVTNGTDVSAAAPRLVVVSKYLN